MSTFLVIEKRLSKQSGYDTRGTRAPAFGTKYKYLIYIDINDESYLEQVYINASSQSIDTQIRILKFDGGDYRYYSEPYKNSEKINSDKEFNLPKVLSVGKIVN